MNRTSLPFRFLALSFVTLAISSSALGQTKPTSKNSQAVESGTFHFFDTKQPAGEESYEITSESGKLKLTSRLELERDDEKISLAATLIMRPDLTPERFEIKGKKPSGSQIDTTLDIGKGSANIIENGRGRQVILPGRFFTVDGYAPIAIEMMLLRYWRSHPGKGPLATLPGSEVTIENVGRDAVTIDGKRLSLDRYDLSGLSWGVQTLWLDSDSRLVAAIGIGADIESVWPVVLEGFQPALPFFLKRAAEDAIDRLTGIATRLGSRSVAPLAITGATLIDGTGTAPVADSVVIIEGDRIRAAGLRSQVTIPKGAIIIDARGKFLLPGLWDMHSHNFQAEFGPAYLAAGVTTVRDVGNDFEFVIALRDASTSRRGLGPWMLLAGYIEGKNDQHAFDIQVDTPEEARAAVTRYKNAGFEQIKIRDHIKPEILKIIAEEAHRLGMTLTGHVPKAMNAIQAVEAGQDQISHFNFVAPVLEFKRNPAGRGFIIDIDAPKTKRAIELFKQRGTVIDATLVTLEMFARQKGASIEVLEPGFAKLPQQYAEHLKNGGLPPAQSSMTQNAVATYLSAVGALHRAGIPIVAGTDVSVLGHSLHRELELFVKSGFTPMEAIQAATIVSARAMKLDKEVGTIEAGKRADLIVLDADPLESISNIRRVRSVVAQGRMFDCAQLWKVVGFKP